MPAIEGWGSPNCVRNVVQKLGENNQKVWKIGQVVCQTFALGLE
jgi:hypothetical protein